MAKSHVLVLDNVQIKRCKSGKEAELKGLEMRSKGIQAYVFEEDFCNKFITKKKTWS